MIIAIPAYFIVIIYSIILKLAACFDGKWTQEERPSFLGYLWFNSLITTMMISLGYILYYFSDTANEDFRTNKKRPEEPFGPIFQNKKSTLQIIVYSSAVLNLVFLLASIRLKKSIRQQFGRIIAAWINEEDGEEEERESTG